jgi:5-methylcytosine-specific restriction endonuclease McrBC regulatory subunit McrC
MSAKGKDKADDTTSVTSDNKGKKALISVTTITVVKLKKDIFIKVREPAIFIGERIKFAIYKTSVDLAV